MKLLVSSVLGVDAGTPLRLGTPSAHQFMVEPNARRRGERTPGTRGPSAISKRASSRTLLALLVVAPAILLRVASIGFNEVPHGDVLIDALAAETMAEKGRLAVPLVLVSSVPSARGAETLLDYRYPLWPLLAAPFVWLSGDGYRASRALSLASGLAFLWLAYAVFRDLFGGSTAFVTLLCCSYSYLLIDFSGNGSLYQLHALLFVAFLFGIARLDRLPYAALTGAIAGAACLLHYSGVVLAIGLGLIQLARWHRRKLAHAGLEVWLPLAIASLIPLPWFARNVALFGPVLPSGSDYFWFKLGVPWTIAVENGQPRVTFADVGLSAEQMWTMARWTAQNAYYTLRQLLVLVPVFALTAPLGARLVWRRWLSDGRAEDAAMLLIPLLFCLGTCAWPVVKFRTFVVVVPLAFALGAHGALRGLPPFWARATVTAGVAAVLLSSALTFAGTDSHTYYYDGVLRRDNFGKAGEAEFVAEQRELRRLSDTLTRRRKAAVLSEELNVYYYTRFPLVQLVPQMDDAGLLALRREHAVGHVVTRREQIARYEALFGARVIEAGERFASLELPSEEAAR